MRYFFAYDYTRKDDPNPDNAQVYRFGDLFELLARADYIVPVSDKLGVFVGAHLGPSILFPSGDLKTQIQALKDQGVHVWSSPRLGYVVGAQLGVRYRLHERVYLRPEFALSWEHLFLFDTKHSVGGIPVDKETSAGITRTSLGLAVELTL